MSDSQLRELERQAQQGDQHAGARLLQERVRVGQLNETAVRLAAFLGSPTARIAVPDSGCFDCGYNGFCTSCGGSGMGPEPDLYPCDECGGARDGPECECEWSDTAEMEMDLDDWLIRAKDLASHLPDVKQVVELELEGVYLNSVHNCGRRDCGLKRNEDGELYWAKLVCGHGYYPCGTCSYPIHSDGPCPMTGVESWVATTSAAKWVSTRIALAVCWEIYAIRNEGDGYCGENRYDESRAPRMNGRWLVLHRIERWLSGPNKRDHEYIEARTQDNYDCPAFDTPGHAMNGAWGAWEVCLRSTTHEFGEEHEEIIRRLACEALVPTLLEGTWTITSPYKKRH